MVQGEIFQENLTILNQDSHSSIDEMDYTVKNFPTKKALEPQGFIGEFNQVLKDCIISTYTNSFSTWRRKKHFHT